MDIIESFAEKARITNLTVVLPEGRDERIIQAARRLKDDNIAEPIVLGSPGQIAAAVERAGVGLDGIAVINPRENDKLAAYAERYSLRREGISVSVAKRIVSKPLAYAGCNGLSNRAVTVYLVNACYARDYQRIRSRRVCARDIRGSLYIV